MIARVLHGVVLLTVGAVAACAGELSSETQWSITLTSPLVDERVPFCPAILTEGSGSVLDGTFAVPAGISTQRGFDESSGVYTFSGVSAADSSSIGGTLTALFASPMSFDLGPIGSVYDLGAPVPVPWFGARQPTSPTTGVNVTRTLVGGGRKAEDKVELVYDYAPDCETIVVTENLGAPQSCECERQTFTYEFEGVQ